MMLSDMEFNMGMEYSPATLHGLSHREVGDHSDAVSLLFEAPEPFLDATRGKTTREQLLTGKDEFVVKAGEAGLLFEDIDENGWPMDVRVGRHTSAILMTMESWTESEPGPAPSGSGACPDTTRSSNWGLGIGCMTRLRRRRTGSSSNRDLDHSMIRSPGRHLPGVDH